MMSAGGNTLPSAFFQGRISFKKKEVKLELVQWITKSEKGVLAAFCHKK